MLNTQRFYIKPLAYLIMNSLALTPFIASVAVAEENEREFDMLQGINEGTSEVKDFFSDSNFSVNPSETGLSISAGDQSASISTDDEMFTSDDKEAQAMVDKAKNLGESDSLQSAIDYGQQLKSKYATEDDTSDMGPFIRRIRK